jgi:hypothetical protein
LADSSDPVEPPAKAPALSKVTKSKQAAAKKTKPVGSAKDTAGRLKREPAKAMEDFTSHFSEPYSLI